jgi:RNA polymerase sigma-70 factor (ECF subfamily)
MTSVDDVVAATHRSDWGRIVAGLIRLTGEWTVAEDATQDAFASALTRWPIDGVPERPAAWLTTTARHRAIDLLRARRTQEAKLGLLALEHGANDSTAAADDRLQLIFTCCHPALPLSARVALTLRTVAGLEVGDIADAFLVPEATMAQRLVRARRKIAHAAIPYRVPPDDVLGDRLDGVLGVLYLVFNTGYSGGTSTELTATAIALAEAVVDLMPRESEARGLLALMLFQNSRRVARFSTSGELLTLEEQDRSLWFTDDVDRGRAILASASGRGPYVVQASLAECHAIAPSPAATDWRRIVSLYDDLLTLSPSPVAWFNRAIAVGMCDGPEAGLALLDELPQELDGFRLVPAARADLLRRAGRMTEAIDQYREAIPLAATDFERAQLWRKLSELHVQVE